jgi:hypothetical protein
MSELQPKCGMLLTPALRKYLAWSWNYGIAESMRDDTCKHNAEWVSAGIGRGEDAGDVELLRSFLIQRTPHYQTEWLYWVPDEPKLQHELSELRTRWIVIEQEACDHARHGRWDEARKLLDTIGTTPEDLGWPTEV